MNEEYLRDYNKQNQNERVAEIEDVRLLGMRRACKMARPRIPQGQESAILGNIRSTGLSRNNETQKADLILDRVPSSITVPGRRKMPWSTVRQVL